MKMRLVLIFSLFVPSLHCIAQKVPDKYWVEFTDKRGVNFSPLRPQDFLSPESMERRQAQGIMADFTDLPVSLRYLDAVKGTGAKVFYTSKWFNGALVRASGDTLSKIKALPFVKGIRFVGYTTPSNKKAKKPAEVERISNYKRSKKHYGKSENQIEMLNGIALHKLGINGKGLKLAVFDGGFTNFHVMPAFDSIRLSGRLIETRDFVEGDQNVYESSSHGTNVMSCIAANMPGLIVGTGPGVEAYLFKTEDTDSEMPIEEYNWLRGAEYSDSLGIKVINSSLGYTEYDDELLSYSHQSLNGNTTAVSRAADFAASKGILVCNSAGNEGSKDWRKIGTPADADSILTVGSVTEGKEKSSFSSFGPTADGRIKPDVVARGSATCVASLYGYDVSSSSGTSFSSPVMAGMVASLWSAFPEVKNMDIIEAVKLSGSQVNSPDVALGYGIPDIMKAYSLLSNNIYQFSTSGCKYIGLMPKSWFGAWIPKCEDEKGVRVRLINWLDQVLEEKTTAGEDWLIFTMEGRPMGTYSVVASSLNDRFRVDFFYSETISPKP